MIKNGQVIVYFEVEETVQTLASLGSGQFFGEGALLKGKSARRGANVSAVTYSLIYSLHVDEMHKILPRYPKVMGTIASIAAEREAATETAAATATMMSNLHSPNGTASSPVHAPVALDA